MGGLYLLLPTLFVILVSFLMVRAAAIALMMTGMDEKRSRFQAFSGTGFTTKEAEFVMNHPVRRRIITWLIILGNVGIVTSKGYKLPINVLILLIGIYVIYKVATRRKLIRKWESFVENRLIKSSAFEEAATEDLPPLMEGYDLGRAIVKNLSICWRFSVRMSIDRRGTTGFGYRARQKLDPYSKGERRDREGRQTCCVWSSRHLEGAIQGG